MGEGSGFFRLDDVPLKRDPMDKSTLLNPEQAEVIQAFGSLKPAHLGLRDDVRHRSVAMLNRLLAHTMALRDLYKRSHWQTSGATFHDLHELR